MSSEERIQKGSKPKGFFARLIEKLDKKMEEKAKKNCCNNGKDKQNSCCS